MRKISFWGVAIFAIGILISGGSALARPSAPTNLSPTNNSTISDLTPKLDWSDVSGAVEYIYEIFYTDVKGSTSQSELTVPEGKLDAGKAYSWNVKACSQPSGRDCSSSSSSWGFTTPKLGAPNLVSPADNEKIADLMPELKWDSVDNAYQYIVVITDRKGSVVFSQTTKDTSITVPSGKLKRGNAYKWKIGVCGANCITYDRNISTLNSERNFYTQDALPVPKQISPTNYISISTPPVILDWEAIYSGFFKNSVYQYSYQISGGQEVIRTTDVSRATINDVTRGATYYWKVRYCTDFSANDCGKWSPSWYFFVSSSLEGLMVIKTDAPGKYIDYNPRSRREVCNNARYDRYQTNECYKIYDSCFDQYGYRERYCHITVQASFIPTNSYNIYFIDPDTGIAYKNLDMVPIGKSLKLVVEEPEGEWFMAGGSFDSPPISWVDDAASDYQKNIPTSIDPLYEYTIDAHSVSREAYNILRPKLGVAATDPMKSGRISVEEVESIGKFEIYKENDDYFIKALASSGLGIIQVTIPDAFAYGTIDNMWFSSGKIPGAAQILYFSLTDDQAPIADAKISIDGVSYSEGPVDAMEGNSTIYLSAEGSNDPDGWSSEKGVANGGFCEWRNSLAQVIFRKDNPLSPAECNTSVVNPTSVGQENYTLVIRDNPGLSVQDSVMANILGGTDILKVCINSCNSGTTPLSIANYLSIRVDDERDLKACYGVASGCNDSNPSADITGSAGWSITSDPDNAVNLTGNNPKVVKGIKEGIARLRASSGSDSQTFEVRVSDNSQYCGDGICSENETCRNCEQDCGKCPPDYIEVTP